MKSIILLITSLLLITFTIGCNKSNNPSVPQRPIDTGLYLSKFEADSLINIKWCEDIIIKKSGKNCEPLTVWHKITKFSNQEYYVELYNLKKKSISCSGYGNVYETEIKDLLDNGSYRVSFKDKNLATMTQIDGEKKSYEVDFYVDSAYVKFAPTDKTIKPGQLSRCPTNF